MGCYVFKANIPVITAFMKDMLDTGKFRREAGEINVEPHINCIIIIPSCKHQPALRLLRPQCRGHTLLCV